MHLATSDALTIVAASAAALRETDIVLGVALGGEARAYPVSLMWGPEHEVVNDTLGGRAIATTWCPLAHSGVVYDRVLEGKTLEVELVREDQPDAEPIKRSIAVTGPSVNVEFDLDGVEVGRKAYVIRTPVLEGETRDDNNSRSFAFAVVDDRAKVFLIEGDAR